MKFRVPEIFLGAFLTIAVFSMGILFSSQYSDHVTKQPAQQETSSSGNNAKNPDTELTGSTWLTKDASGFFTFALVIVGGIQAILFLAQLKLIRESLAPAKAAADAARIAAEHIPRVERAYVFLAEEIKHSRQPN